MPRRRSGGGRWSRAAPVLPDVGRGYKAMEKAEEAFQAAASGAQNSGVLNPWFGLKADDIHAIKNLVGADACKSYQQARRMMGLAYGEALPSKAEVQTWKHDKLKGTAVEPLDDPRQAYEKERAARHAEEEARQAAIKAVELDMPRYQDIMQNQGVLNWSQIDAERIVEIFHDIEKDVGTSASAWPGPSAFDHFEAWAKSYANCFPRPAQNAKAPDVALHVRPDEGGAAKPTVEPGAVAAGAGGHADTPVDGVADQMPPGFDDGFVVVGGSDSDNEYADCDVEGLMMGVEGMTPEQIAVAERAAAELADGADDDGLDGLDGDGLMMGEGMSPEALAKAEAAAATWAGGGADSGSGVDVGVDEVGIAWVDKRRADAAGAREAGAAPPAGLRVIPESSQSQASDESRPTRPAGPGGSSGSFD